MKPHTKPACPGCGICLMCIGEGKAEHAEDCTEVRFKKEKSDE